MSHQTWTTVSIKRATKDKIYKLRDLSEKEIYSFDELVESLISYVCEKENINLDDTALNEDK